MKKKLMAILLASALAGALVTGCGGSTGTAPQSTDNAAEAVSEAAAAAGTAAESAAAAETAAAAKTDEEIAAECGALIEALNVQERTDTTDADIAAAKAAWDALTDEQKALVEDPDYFGRDTGDASADDPLNADEIGENELLVVSFGTSFNDSRATDIGGIEKALQEANPDWSVRRAFTSQIIINHVQARDGEVIDNIDQALARAKDNGVKNLVIQPTHLMHGAEYDELMESVTAAAADFETVRIAEPLLGEVGEDATIINEDKEAVAKAAVAQAVEDAGFESLDAAWEDKTAFVFMGHGTAHVAKVTYSQMQTQMEKLEYDNVFVGTVEGEPEETACANVIEKVKEAGYKKVILRPLMVVAGDHANNDMAGEDEDSWKSMFTADGSFESVDCQIAGLGRIEDIEALYAAHTAAAMDAEPLDAEAIKQAQEAIAECGALIEALNVQERTETTDDDIAAAKAAWDALTDEQKAQVEDPDYFGRDTGDASADDPLNADGIGENELLVVSFGTSFNDSRATDIGGIEKALQEANPDWSVRRAFTSQIIINHVQARDGEVIDNVDQALARAKDNGVKNLVIQPTHLMHGAEYDELMTAIDAVKGDFETVSIAEPLLGEVGEDATVINEDKETVAKAVVAEAVNVAGFDSIEAADEDGTAFVFMGHGTAHVASVTYSQMQTQMDTLGYKNVFIGTVEGEPEETACENVIAKVKEAGYKKVVLRPLMVVAGDHANNDMAGEDADSWKSMFTADGSFEQIDCQIEGLGRIADIEAVYVAHTEEAMKGDEAAEGATAEDAAAEETTAEEAGAEASEEDQKLAEECSALIEALNVQERTDTTDDDIAAAKAAWDALTEEQKKLVEDPDYFGRDTGDASADDPLNADEIGNNEMLIVSFGTSFNDSRATDIGGIEKAVQAAYPDWSVRRAFTAQIIINHVQARDGEVIDNVEQALARAKENGVKNLAIQPTHLMHGAEYDELMAAVEAAKADFDTVSIAEPLLGEVGEDATIVNEDKEAVAKAVVEEAVEKAGFESLEAAEQDGTAFVFMGHGTAHVASVTYSQMQTQMDTLGYKNVFIGTVEGEPEETACENVIAKIKEAGYKKVVLRPLMVVAGDHANNDMAGDDEDSWKSMFTADGSFDKIDCQIEGLGRIPEVQDLYLAHMAEAIDGLDITAPAAGTTEENAEETSEESSENESEESASAPIEDGTYTATFKTDSSMFHVNEANDGKGTLTVENGQMTIHVSLVSKKILNLYQGTAEEAQQEGSSILQPTTDSVTYSDGETEEVYGFDIPVPALDKEFDCAIIGEKGKWYDHKVIVSNPVKE